MTDERRFRSIQSRYDIEIGRWSFVKRRRRRTLTMACGLLTLLACVPLLFSDHRVFEARPVSRSHQIFEHNCQACHDRHWQPLKRPFAWGVPHHSVSDQACRQCHGETNADHLLHAGAQQSLMGHDSTKQNELLNQQFQNVACAGCHQEHRGSDALAQVPDRYCVDCHQELAEQNLKTAFMLNFETFAAHPEFAVVAKKEQGANSGQRSTPSGSLVHFESGETRDQSAFKFNHHRHLDPGLRAGGNKTQTLNCQDCHVPAEGGAYFQSIRFETHCQRCHRLGIQATGELPHVAPEIIRGLLLERLAAKDPDKKDRSTDTIGGPTKPVAEKTTSRTETLEDLRAAAANLESLLFGTSASATDQPAASDSGVIHAACSKCHVTEQQTGAGMNWKVLAPRIPERWMPSSRFDHQAHSAVRCVDCHTRGGRPHENAERSKFYPVLGAKLKDSSSIFASTSAADVLMPSLQECRQCHGHQRSALRAAAARDDCFECHDYHHGSQSLPPNTLMQELFKSENRRAGTAAKANPSETNPVSGKAEAEPAKVP